MNEREPKVMTLCPGRSRDGELILGAVVRIRESAKYILPGCSDDRVLERSALSSCIGSA